MVAPKVVSTTRANAERKRKQATKWPYVLKAKSKIYFRPDRQNLFPIVQGGLDEAKRRLCAAELTERLVPGFAVGGLSGGEAKDSFWRMVHVSTDNLPDNKPCYLMGVGFALDLVVCSALGVDMYDCVFPTRYSNNFFLTACLISFSLESSSFSTLQTIGISPQLRIDDVWCK